MHTYIRIWQTFHQVHDTEWLRTTCEPCMHELTKVYARHFDVTSGLLDQHLRVSK